MAQAAGEWAGIPMPLDGEKLVVEPTFRAAQVLMGKPEPVSAEWEGVKERNRWFNARLRCDVHLYEKKDGTLTYGIAPAVHHLDYDLHTMGCSDAWGIEQESVAMATLGNLVTHRQMRLYLLTGMFPESSKRSGLMYIFRRLKPTVVLASRDGEAVKILATLCMHPIAHYAQSWAGAMCPTDDIIAHLMMMRGDEHMFWRRSNQHAAHRPESGL